MGSVLGNHKKGDKKVEIVERDSDLEGGLEGEWTLRTRGGRSGEKFHKTQE